MAKEFPLSPGSPDADVCYPAKFASLVTLLCDYLTVEMEGVTFFNYGSSTPVVDNEDMPWIRLNTSSGAPQGLYANVAGNWEKFTEFTKGMIVLVPTATTVASPWSNTDGGTINGYLTPNIAPDAWQTGYKTLIYVGDY